MKNKGFLIGTAIGMASGAYLYSYLSEHPIKVEIAKNKVKRAMKDIM